MTRLRPSEAQAPRPVRIGDMLTKPATCQVVRRPKDGFPGSTDGFGATTFTVSELPYEHAPGRWAVHGMLIDVGGITHYDGALIELPTKLCKCGHHIIWHIGPKGGGLGSGPACHCGCEGYERRTGEAPKYNAVERLPAVPRAIYEETCAQLRFACEERDKLRSEAAQPEAHDVGHPHLIGGEFQSDKYPTCPRGKVPLSVKDPTAQDLLWQYAQRRRAVDVEFATDLEVALRLKGYEPKATPDDWRTFSSSDEVPIARVEAIAESGDNGSSDEHEALAREVLNRRLVGRRTAEDQAGGEDFTTHTCPWGSPGFYPDCRGCITAMQAGGHKWDRRERDQANARGDLREPGATHQGAARVSGDVAGGPIDAHRDDAGVDREHRGGPSKGDAARRADAGASARMVGAPADGVVIDKGDLTCPNDGCWFAINHPGKCQPDLAAARNAGEARFFIDHGVVHDRTTGQHVRTGPDDYDEDGTAKTCALLNSLASKAGPSSGPTPSDAERASNLVSDIDTLNAPSCAADEIAKALADVRSETIDACLKWVDRNVGPRAADAMATDPDLPFTSDPPRKS